MQLPVMPWDRQHSRGRQRADRACQRAVPLTGVPSRAASKCRCRQSYGAAAPCDDFSTPDAARSGLPPSAAAAALVLSLNQPGCPRLPQGRFKVPVSPVVHDTGTVGGHQSQALQRAG